MEIRWYIEAHGTETWRTISDLFGEWMDANVDVASLKSFGFSEGDSIFVGDSDVTLLCFKFPSRHGKYIDLFEQWAETTDRLYGRLKDGKIAFPRRADLTVIAPPERTLPTPSWLE
jgi:hypothetical protein